MSSQKYVVRSRCCDSRSRLQPRSRLVRGLSHGGSCATAGLSNAVRDELDQGEQNHTRSDQRQTRDPARTRSSGNQRLTLVPLRVRRRAHGRARATAPRAPRADEHGSEDDEQLPEAVVGHGEPRTTEGRSGLHRARRRATTPRRRIPVVRNPERTKNVSRESTPPAVKYPASTESRGTDRQAPRASARADRAGWCGSASTPPAYRSQHADPPRARIRHEGRWQKETPATPGPSVPFSARTLDSVAESHPTRTMGR